MGNLRDLCAKSVTDINIIYVLFGNTAMELELREWEKVV